MRAVTAAGCRPDAAPNDAIAPLRSQFHGEVIDVVRADHLDVIGHVAGGARAPEHNDWLETGSGFRRPTFVELWGRVADFIVECDAVQ